MKIIGMDEIIAYNVRELLKKQNKNKSDLEKFLNLDKVKFRSLLNGNYTFRQNDLNKLSEYFNVDISVLTNTDVDLISPIDRLKQLAENENQLKAIEFADEISDLILFHSRVRKNAEKMRRIVDVE